MTILALNVAYPRSSSVSVDYSFLIQEEGLGQPGLISLGGFELGGVLHALPPQTHKMDFKSHCQSNPSSTRIES